MQPNLCKVSVFKQNSKWDKKFFSAHYNIQFRQTYSSTIGYEDRAESFLKAFTAEA